MDKLGSQTARPKFLHLCWCLMGCLLFSPSWCRAENLKDLDLEQIRSKAEQGDPGQPGAGSRPRGTPWIPAYAGMTIPW